MWLGSIPENRSQLKHGSPLQCEGGDVDAPAVERNQRGSSLSNPKVASGRARVMPA
jgi:hypothetical protein